MIWLLFGISVLFFTYLGMPGNRVVGKKNIHIIFQVILIIILSVMTGLGGIESTDHSEYVHIFNNTKNISFFNYFSSINLSSGSFRDINYTYEFGYIWFNILCHSIGLGEGGFFFMAALFTNFFVVKTLYRFRYPVLAILFFIASRAYLQEPNIVRQTMAISVFAYSLKYLESKHFYKYLFFILLASSLHTSLFLTLALYPITFLKSRKSFYSIIFFSLIIWGLSLASALFGVSYDEGIIKSFASIYSHLLESEDSLRQIYIDYRLNIAILLLFFSYFYYFRKYKENSPLGFDIYMFCTILCAILCNISVNIYFFFRVSLIFDIIYCFYLPKILQNIKIAQNINGYSIPFILVFLFKLAAFTRFALTEEYLIGNSFYSLKDIFV